MKSVLKYNIISLGVLVGLSFALIGITNHYILTINFYINNGDPLSGIPVNEGAVFHDLQKWIYFSTAGYVIFKLLLITLILYTALYTADQDARFDKVFLVVTLSEFIFFIPAIIKMVWFHFEYPQGTLEEWQRLYVFSVLTLFNSVSPDWYYPLQTLNIFELGYWISLAYGISKVSAMDFDESLCVVLFSYLPALFVWVCIVAFATIMVVPGNA